MRFLLAFMAFFAVEDTSRVNAQPPRGVSPPSAAPLCICGDSCACKPGTCPSCPTTFIAADDGYAKVYERVAKGQTVFVAVGVPPVAECVAVKNLPGVAPGYYRCKKNAAGVHLMQPGEFRRVCHGSFCSWEFFGK